MMRRAYLLAAWAAAACGDDRAQPDAGSVDATAAVDAAPAVSVRGNRYCEVLPVFLDTDVVQIEVWGTQGLNACPAAAWATVDASALQQQLGALMVVKNGPRYWVLDGVEAFALPTAPHRFYGTLETQQLATLRFPVAQLSTQPYTERVVNRDTAFRFFAGTRVYELVAADGAVYAMQSYAQIVDPALTEPDLPALATRLALPAGWSFRVRTLAADLELRAAGTAVVLQDDLQNTYQRHD